MSEPNPDELPINFRDFGGTPAAGESVVKRGVLYRCGMPPGLRDLSPIQALGIRTLIDLRSARERRHKLKVWPGAQVVWLPLTFDALVRKRMWGVFPRHSAIDAVYDIVNGVYSDTVDQARPQIGKLFQTLNDPDVYPVLIFCRAGRDRTGFVSAVIQRALGVGTDDIVAEYMRSKATLLSKSSRGLTLLERISVHLFAAQGLSAVFTSRERYIRTILDKIEGYGGITGYLEQCGVEEQSLETIKRLLLKSILDGEMLHLREANSYTSAKT